MNIYEKVSTTCKERKISQEELEKQAGLGRRTIYNWKKSAPSAENLFKVSKALDLSIYYFLDEAYKDESQSMTVDEKELLQIYRAVSIEGKAAIMTSARAFAGQVDYTKTPAASETA